MIPTLRGYAEELRRLISGDVEIRLKRLSLVGLGYRRDPMGICLIQRALQLLDVDRLGQDTNCAGVFQICEVRPGRDQDDFRVRIFSQDVPAGGAAIQF